MELWCIKQRKQCKNLNFQRDHFSVGQVDFLSLNYQIICDLKVMKLNALVMMKYPFLYL